MKSFLLLTVLQNCIASSHQLLNGKQASIFKSVFLRSFFFKGRTQRSNIQGSIHVKMWLSTRENRGLTEEEGMWNEIWQHQQIYTILLRHQILNTKVSKSSPLKKESISSAEMETKHFVETSKRFSTDSPPLSTANLITVN